ncbi:MAG: hypothetical protein ABSC54_04120 [Smithellaceae bacterium]|jgi:hypothetical protein
MKEDEKDNAEWARLIYRNYIDCIEAVKRRQWAATNYILLIFAAIIGYARLYQINEIDVKIVIFLLILVFPISIVGIYHLSDMHYVMTKYRKILFNITEEYTYVPRFYMLEDDDASFFKYFSITIFFIALVLVGLTFVVLFLYNLAWNNISAFPICCCLTMFLSIDIILAIVFTFDNLEKWKKLR